MKTFESWPIERAPDSSKRDYGCLLIVAGSESMPGAAGLAVSGAIRSGIGLVTVASVASVIESVSVRMPEALILKLESQDGAVVGEVNEIRARTWDAAVFGPGLSTHPGTLSFLGELWDEWRSPCVVDADALNAVANGVEMPRCDCVLTPHEGEIARLLNVEVGNVRQDRVGAVNAAAAKFRCSVVLKGHNSLVATPGKELYINHTGNPGMATGGMGDVLSGVVGTLLAQGYSPHEAAKIGVYWHGLAGDFCAKKVGPYGYTASEVAGALPEAMRSVREGKN